MALPSAAKFGCPRQNAITTTLPTEPIPGQDLPIAYDLLSLTAHLTGLLGQGDTSVVLVLFDGLGTQFLGERVPHLTASHTGNLRAPFPSTTTVSLTTLTTGREPAAHGVIGHLMWQPEVARVVNMLKFVDLSGAPVELEYPEIIPQPNLWERLAAQGIEAITVQPADFVDTPLTRMLYRGCRFVGAREASDFVEATVVAASVPRRLVFTYLPPVDFAAHVFGTGSAEVGEALTWVDGIWADLSARLPPGVKMFGTADHGVMEIPEEGKILIRDERYRPLDYWGDPRAVMVRGSMRLIRELGNVTGARLLTREEFRPWLGEGDEHPRLESRLPDTVLLARPGTVILPPGFDKRLRGYHGGIDPIEVEVPLLVAG